MPDTLNTKLHADSLIESHITFMLSLTEIMVLSLQEKVQYVWNRGMYCNSSWEGIYRINLYWMGNFYAQVWLDNTSHQVRDIILKEAFQNH